ncbi:MAG: dihydrofolate reductase [Pyrinomonadaceae bacterium]
MIIGIVAISKNYAIGKEGKLPWHYSADLKFFKETTTGNAVVMGANTWRSIGRPLPNRLNIVLSRSGNVDTPPTVLKLSSKAEVVELAKYFERDVFIIGGAQTYADFADVIDQWIVTFVPIEVEDADTFMPEDFLDGFETKQTIEFAEDVTIKTLRRS